MSLETLIGLSSKGAIIASIAAIGASFSIEDVGTIVTTITAAGLGIATFIFKSRKDKRDKRYSDALIKSLENKVKKNNA